MRHASLLAAIAFAMFAVGHAVACTITAPGIAFGAYDPRSAAPDNGTGTITAVCPTSVTAPVVQLSPGTSGTFTARRMVSGAWALNYNLYSDSARTAVWGDGTGGTAAVTLSGGVVIRGQQRFTRTVYGRIAARQNVGAGSYGDTVFMTIVF